MQLLVLHLFIIIPIPLSPLWKYYGWTSLK